MSVEPPPPTRFERQVWVGNWLDQLQAVDVRTQVIIRQVQIVPFQQRLAGFHGSVSHDPQYQIDMSFALENEGGYAAVLPTMEGDRIYQIRLQLAQHAKPEILGFALRWLLPAGWGWTDALPTVTYEEFYANPMTIIRTARSPANPAPSVFQVLVDQKYS